jgi:hypothetical protein
MIQLIDGVYHIFMKNPYELEVHIGKLFNWEMEIEPKTIKIFHLYLLNCRKPFIYDSGIKLLEFIKTFK